MADILRIFKLKVKSSYRENKEYPADEQFDTLQIYIHGDTIMRIKTYVVDSDIHVHQIPLRERTVEETFEFLTSSTKEHYGDVIGQEYTLHLSNPEDTETAKAFFIEHKLNPELVSKKNYAYWNPNGTKYENKSNPFG